LNSGGWISFLHPHFERLDVTWGLPRGGFYLEGWRSEYVGYGLEEEG
jgi:hypothetical protein